jgi:hypothetical protein
MEETCKLTRRRPGHCPPMLTQPDFFVKAANQRNRSLNVAIVNIRDRYANDPI